MGLASALNTALTGMGAAETTIDVIGNNLANSRHRRVQGLDGEFRDAVFTNAIAWFRGLGQQRRHRSRADRLGHVGRADHAELRPGHHFDRFNDERHGHPRERVLRHARPHRRATLQPRRRIHDERQQRPGQLHRIQLARLRRQLERQNQHLVAPAADHSVGLVDRGRGDAERGAARGPDLQRHHRQYGLDPGDGRSRRRTVHTPGHGGHGHEHRRRVGPRRHLYLLRDLCQAERWRAAPARSVCQSACRMPARSR